MKKITILTIFLIIMLFATTAYAEPTATIKLTSDKTKLSAGEEVTITLTATTTDMQEIMAYTAVLEYDTNVFEKATDTSVKGTGKNVVFNPETNKIVVSGTGVSETITLKVKSDIATTITNTTVTVKEFVGIDNNTAQNAATSNSIKFNIETNSGTNGNNSNNNIINNNNNVVSENKVANAVISNNNVKSTNNIVQNKVNNNVISNTVATTKLPKTGVDQTAIFAIIILLVVASISIIKYRKASK